MANECRNYGPIQKIPLEVLLRISHHLKTPDLGRFRLTCRSIEQSLYNTFTLEFFTRKQFMLTENSLQALIDISRSRLGAHLRCVYIGLDRFPEDMRRPQPEEAKEIRFREQYANQFALWNTGNVQKMLAEAFRGLDNLEDVVIRDFNSRRRNRDNPHAEWTSYGSTTVLAETGVHLVQRSLPVFATTAMSPQFCSQVFSAVLYSLGEAATKLRGIEIMSRNQNNLQDFAFMVPKFIESSVLPLLQGLQKLHLCIDLSWRSSGMNHGHQIAVPDLFLRRFLTYTPNLKNLRVNEMQSSHPGVGEFLKWMALPTSPVDVEAKPNRPMAVDPNVFPDPIHLQHLEVLSLGMMNVEVPQLLGVIRKYAPSLRSLALHKISIVRALPSVDTGAPPKTIFWTGVLEKIKSMPNLNLRHIQLSCLRQQWLHRPVASDIKFKEGTLEELAREYTGPDWKHYMEEVMPQLHINWPRDEEDYDSSDSLNDEDSGLDYGEDDDDDEDME